MLRAWQHASIIWPTRRRNPELRAKYEKLLMHETVCSQWPVAVTFWPTKRIAGLMRRLRHFGITCTHWLVSRLSGSKGRNQQSPAHSQMDWRSGH